MVKHTKAKYRSHGQASRRGGRQGGGPAGRGHGGKPHVHMGRVHDPLGDDDYILERPGNAKQGRRGGRNNKLDGKRHKHPDSTMMSEARYTSLHGFGSSNNLRFMPLNFVLADTLFEPLTKIGSNESDKLIEHQDYHDEEQYMENLVSELQEESYSDSTNTSEGDGPHYREVSNEASRTGSIADSDDRSDGARIENLRTSDSEAIHSETPSLEKVEENEEQTRDDGNLFFIDDEGDLEIRRALEAAHESPTDNEADLEIRKALEAAYDAHTDDEQKDDTILITPRSMRRNNIKSSLPEPLPEPAEEFISLSQTTPLSRKQKKKNKNIAKRKKKEARQKNRNARPLLVVPSDDDLAIEDYLINTMDSSDEQNGTHSVNRVMEEISQIDIGGDEIYIPSEGTIQQEMSQSATLKMSKTDFNDYLHNTDSSITGIDRKRTNNGILEVSVRFEDSPEVLWLPVEEIGADYRLLDFNNVTTDEEDDTEAFELSSTRSYSYDEFNDFDSEDLRELEYDEALFELQEDELMNPHSGRTGAKPGRVGFRYGGGSGGRSGRKIGNVSAAGITSIRPDDLIDESDLEDDPILEIAANLDIQRAKDRKKKAEKKKEREQLRQAGMLGKKFKDTGQYDLRDKYLDGISASNVHEEMFEFFQDGGRSTLSLPPMSKEYRKKLHIVGMRMELKTQSIGSGKTRFLSYIKKTHVDYSKFEHELIARILTQHLVKFSPRMDRAGGRKVGGGGGVDRSKVRPREGEVVGAYAPEIGTENRGRSMLERMGWSLGEALGTDNNKGLLVPVEARIKTSKKGLGS